MLQDHNCEDSELYFAGATKRLSSLLHLMCCCCSMILWFCDSKSTVLIYEKLSRKLKESEIFCWLHRPKKIRINRCRELSSSWIANCNFFSVGRNRYLSRKAILPAEPKLPRLKQLLASKRQHWSLWLQQWNAGCTSSNSQLRMTFSGAP